VSNPLIQEVNSFLTKHVSPSDRLLVAVSGGADSMGLLGLLGAKGGINTGRLVAGYVDHGLRADSARDIETVKQLADSFKIRVQFSKVNTIGLAEKEHLSLEAAARRLRYSELARMADESNCRWILTAHTMDDSAETVLMRLQSGAPFYECTSIPEKRGNILRPLLSCRRTLIRDWVSSQRISFNEDVSNQDTRFSRNRLRVWLAQKPAFWNDRNIHRMHAAGRDLGLALLGYSQTADLFVQARRVGDDPCAVGLAINEILRYFGGLTFVPVEVAWAQMAGRQGQRLPSAMRRQIADCLTGNSNAARLDLSEGVRFERRGERVWLLQGQITAIRRSIGRGRTPIPERNGTIVIRDGFSSANSSQAGCIMDADFLERDLVLRGWEPGDRINVRGRPTKKIADLLAEQKLDPLGRKKIMVLADDEGPIWVVGGPLAERAEPRGNGHKSVWVSWESDD